MAARRKIKKRPPRLFTKKGKLYVRIGNKKYLIKDQDRYTKKEILDTILEDVLIKRKKTRSGKVTKKERKSNRRNMANFRKIQKLNNNNSRDFKLPSGFTNQDDQFKNLLSALAKILTPKMEDVNLKTRREIKEAAEQRKKKEDEAKAKAVALVPFKPISSSSPPPSSRSSPPPISSSSSSSISSSRPPPISSSSRPVLSPPPSPPSQARAIDLSAYGEFKKEIRNEMAGPGVKKVKNILKEINNDKKLNISIASSSGKGAVKAEDLFDAITKIYEDKDQESELYEIFISYFGSIENIKQLKNQPPPPPSSGAPPPPPGPPGAPGAPSKTEEVSKPLDLLDFRNEAKLTMTEKKVYNNMTNQITNKFGKGKQLAKRNQLQKLIEDEKMGINFDHVEITTQGKDKGKVTKLAMKKPEELSKEIIKYYEKQDKRAQIPIVINKYFPNGIDNVETSKTVETVWKKPTAKTTEDQKDAVKKELMQKLAKNKGKAAAGETIEQKMARITQEKREARDRETETMVQMLKDVKLKQTKQEEKKEEKKEEKEDIPELEEVEEVVEDLPPPLEVEEVLDIPEPEEVEQAVAALSTIEQDADGDYYSGDGLSTSQIDEFIDSMGMNNYIGTLPADFMKHLPANLPKEFGFIMNLDKSNKPGSHWVGVYVDTLNNNSIEYYDSFGREPTKDFMKQIKKLIDRLEPNTYLKFKVNRIQDQNVKTSNCGFFCLRWMLDKATGKNFKESTRFNPNGEAGIEAWKQQFSYI